jgi:DNA-binding CsgD family transcriptional regulator
VAFDGYLAHNGPSRLVDELTVIEVETLRYLSHGLGRADIARLRHVSPETVKSQTDRLRSKLAAKTTAHAVAIALRHGLIT